MRQLRQPRLAEIVAASLRDDILSGRLKEGDSLPRQEDLNAEFKVSLPAVREAMRILETEGLISVRRGNVGGAVVHQPTSERTAYMISMVLQTRGTGVEDVSAALLRLEPVCAAMCAARPDRGEILVPALRGAIESQRAEFDDPARYNALARRFHEVLVSGCGSDTMIVLIGALESIWSAHETSVWDEAAGPGEPDPDSALAVRSRTVALRDHERLLSAIASGNAEAASGLAEAHLAATRASTLASAPQLAVRANLVDRGDTQPRSN